MMRDALLILLFLGSAVLQISFVHSLTPPLAYLPLHFIVGILVLHRSDPWRGAVWFAASAAVLPMFGFQPMHPFVYLAVAITGALLVTRVFTNRSVYALEGIGVALYLLARVLEFFPTLLSEMGKGGATFGSILETHLSLTVAGTLLLMTGLYLGFLLAKWAEYLFDQLFFVSKTHV